MFDDINLLEILKVVLNNDVIQSSDGKVRCEINL